MNFKRSLTGSLIALVSLTLIACSGARETPNEEVAQHGSETKESAQEPGAQPESHSMERKHDMAGHGELMAKCPMHVKGTEMQLEMVDVGVTLTFLNTEHLREVQARTKDLATQHITMMDKHGSHFGGYNVAVERTDLGAKLFLTPPKTRSVEDFQQAVSQRYAEMDSKECPIMLMYDVKGSM